MRAKLLKVSKVTAVIVLALIALAVVTLVVSKTPAFDDFLKTKVVEAAAAEGVELSLEGFDFDPEGPGISLSALEAVGPEGQWHATSGPLYLRLHLVRSFKGVPTFSLKLDSPEIKGTVKASVESAEEPGQTSEGAGFDLLSKFSLRKLRVTGGEVDLTLEAQQLSAKLAGLEIDYSPKRIGFGLEGGEVIWRGESERIEAASLEGQQTITGLEIKELMWRSSRLEITGSATRKLHDRIAARVKARLKAPRLPKEWIKGAGLGFYSKAGLDLSLDGEISGTLKDPRLAALMEISYARLGPMEVTGGSARLGLKDGELGYSDFDATTTAGKVDGLEGRLTWGDEGLALEAHGRGVDYDLRESMRMLGRDWYFPVGLKVSGEIFVRGPLYPEIELECRIEDAVVRDFDVSTYYRGRLREWYSLGETRARMERAVVGRRGIEFGKFNFDNESVSAVVKRGSITYATGLEFDTDLTVRSLDSVQRYLPRGFEAAGRANGHLGGPYKSLEFDYDLEFDSATVFGHELGSATLSAEYDLSLLSFEELKLNGPLGSAEARGSLVTASQGAVDAELEWRGLGVEKLVEVIESFGVKSPVTVEGALEAKGHLGGVASKPVLTGDLTVAGLKVGELGVFRGIEAELVEGSGEFGLDRWLAESFEMSAYDTSWSGELEADLTGYDLAVSSDRFDLIHLERVWLPPLDVAGVAAVELELGGDFGAPLRMGVKARIADPVMEGYGLGGDVELEVAIEDELTRLSGARVDGALDFKANAIPGEKFVMQLQADGLPFAQIPARFIPEGLRGGAVKGEGTLELNLTDGAEPLDTISWEGVVDGVAYRDLGMGEVALKANYPRQMRTGEESLEFDVSWWEGAAGGSALFQLDDSSEKPKGPEVGLVAEGLELERFAPWGLELPGTVTASGRARIARWPLEGVDFREALASLEAIEVFGVVEGLEVAEGVTLWPVEFNVRSEGDDGYVVACSSEEIDSFRMVVDPETLGWKGQMALRGLGLSRFAPGLKGEFDADFSGQVKVEGVAEKLISASGEGDITNIVMPQLAERGGTWEASWGEGFATFAAEVEGGAEVSARYRPREGVEGEVTFNEAPLGRWLPRSEVSEEIKGGFTGAVPFKLGLDGDFLAEATLVSLWAEFESSRVENLGDLEVSYYNGIINFDSVGIAGEGMDIGILGEVEPGKSWALKVKGTADLSALGRRVPDIDSIKGDGYIDLTIVGDWDEPEVSGALEVENASVKLTRLPQPIEEINAKGTLRVGESINIESVEAIFGQGTIRGEGRWKLEGFKPGNLDLLLEAHDIAYQYPAGVSYEFDSDVLVTGDLSGAKVHGEVRLKKFEYTRRTNWRSSALKLFESGRLQQETGQDKRLYLDLAIIGERDLRIENNVSELEFASDLRVVGYLPAPKLWGSVNIKTGKIKFRGRNFRVLRSNVEFLGDFGDNAVVDGRATTQVRQYMVNLSATGPLNDVRVELSSVPALPSTDIVALLALGTTSENLEESEDVTAMEATSFLTGEIQDELEYQMNRTLGFDQFHINPAYSESSETTVPVVTIGRSISEDLYARYSAALDAQAEQEVSLEHALTPRVTLIGSWADEGDEEKGSFGGEIRYRVTYR